MQNDLSALIERVENGAGYDNELNKDVALALGWTIETGLPQGLRWRKPDGTLTAGNPEYEDPINATGSLDGALSLIEAKLPGMSWEVRRSGFGTPSQAMIWDPMKSPPVSTIARISVETTPARALLAAALRAIQSLAMIDEKAIKALAEAIAAERVKQFGAAAGLAPREVEFEYARVAILAYESAKPKEATDAEIGQRAEEDLAAEASLDLWRQRALSAEAKLAQAVEALEPFAGYYGPHYPDTDDRGVPLPDEDGTGWVYLTVGDFRRARSASAAARGAT